MTIEDHDTGADTPKKQLDDLRVSRRKETLPIFPQTPKFSDFAEDYLKFFELAKDKKKGSTTETEKHAINRWKEHLGERRLDKIRPIHVQSFIARRQSDGKAARTFKLEVSVLRNVMNMAIDYKWI